MLCRTWSADVRGIEGLPIEVQVFVGGTFPMFVVAGLPDAAVKEVKARIRSAIDGSGFRLPSDARITVSLAPTDVRKSAAVHDLPVALGVLIAGGAIEGRRADHYAAVGELALDGRIRPVRGVLPMAEAAREKGLRGILVPAENAREAASAGIDAIPVATLREAAAFMAGQAIDPVRGGAGSPPRREEDVDYSEVRGHEAAKRALLVAAAGGHDVMLVGPPGSGKAMLARRLTTILPDLGTDEALAVTRLHSVSGILPAGVGLMADRPFRAPHHTVSEAGLLGGGASPRPGELSLAHKGILFLDDLPEVPRRIQEALAGALGDGRACVGRGDSAVSFPAASLLVASMLPCPCGYWGDPKRLCACGKDQVERYRSRVSARLLDRVGIFVSVAPTRLAELSEAGTASAPMREDVRRARSAQGRRYMGDESMTNGRMRTTEDMTGCELDEASRRIVSSASDKLVLDARDRLHILRIARTIADLDGSETIGAPHVAEAVQYRALRAGLFGRLAGVERD